MSELTKAGPHQWRLGHYRAEARLPAADGRAWRTDAAAPALQSILPVSLTLRQLILLVLVAGLLWRWLFNADIPSYLSGVVGGVTAAVSYTHLRAHETVLDLVCRLLLEKK